MDVARRNGVAVQEALRRMETAISNQQKRIDALSNGISSFAARVADLEMTIAKGRVASMGSGPTVAG